MKIPDDEMLKEIMQQLVFRASYATVTAIKKLNLEPGLKTLPSWIDKSAMVGAAAFAAQWTIDCTNMFHNETLDKLAVCDISDQQYVQKIVNGMRRWKKLSQADFR
jgi:hypothetical protein